MRSLLLYLHGSVDTDLEMVYTFLIILMLQLLELVRGC